MYDEIYKKNGRSVTFLNLKSMSLPVEIQEFPFLFCLSQGTRVYQVLYFLLPINSKQILYIFWDILYIN